MSTCISDRFKLPGDELALEVVRRYPFATLVTPEGEEVRITHIPLLWRGPESGPLASGEMIVPESLSSCPIRFLKAAILSVLGEPVSCVILS